MLPTRASAAAEVPKDVSSTACLRLGSMRLAPIAAWPELAVAMSRLGREGRASLPKRLDV